MARNILYSAEIKEYIFENYGKVSAKKIANHLGVTEGGVRSFAFRNGLCKPIANKCGKKNRFKENPNPPTATTEMLICRYHHDTGGDIKDISLELGRTEEYIKSVLDECMANGNYERYNKYGR